MEVRQNIVLQCQTHGFVKRRVVADRQNGLFDPHVDGIVVCMWISSLNVYSRPQKLEIHRSQQAFPNNYCVANKRQLLGSLPLNLATVP